MIGILFGIIAAVGYIVAAITGDVVAWSSASIAFVLLTVLGVFLFPKTIARYFSIILAAAPIAILISIFTLQLLPSIAVAIGAAIALFIVKALRPRAREVNM